jgi:hypothetical protein
MVLHPNEELALRVAEALDGLKPPFTKEMKMTCVARHPTNPECFVVVTEDDAAAVARVVSPELGSAAKQRDDLRTVCKSLLERLGRSDTDDLDSGRSFANWPELAALRAAVS